MKPYLLSGLLLLLLAGCAGRPSDRDWEAQRAARKAELERACASTGYDVMSRECNALRSSWDVDRAVLDERIRAADEAIARDNAAVRCITRYGGVPNNRYSVTDCR